MSQVRYKTLGGHNYRQMDNCDKFLKDCLMPCCKLTPTPNFNFLFPDRRPLHRQICIFCHNISAEQTTMLQEMKQRQSSLLVRLAFMLASYRIGSVNAQTSLATIRINVNGPAYTDSLNRVWEADATNMYFSGGVGFSSCPRMISNTEDDRCIAPIDTGRPYQLFQPPTMQSQSPPVPIKCHCTSPRHISTPQGNESLMCF
jgi:hypothetical protein